MALTRQELKLLIKEILVEVLSEGLGNVQASARTPVSGKQSVRPARSPFDPRLDTPARQMSEAVRRESAGNPMMAAILADTEAKTLPGMLAGDRDLGRSTHTGGTSPGISQVEQINGTPEQVFGEDTAGRWADLAFADAKKSA